MFVRPQTISLAAFAVLLFGCSKPEPTRAGADPGLPLIGLPVDQSARLSDAEKVREADYSILFVGNSHTSFHELPKVVCNMIQFRQPDKKAYAHVIGVAFLEDVARDPRCKLEVESRPWKH